MNNVIKLITYLSHFADQKVTFVNYVVNDEKIRYLVYDEITKILYFTDDSEELVKKEDLTDRWYKIYNIEEE